MTATINLDEEKLEAFLGRAFADLAACYGGVMVSLGDKLGLYRSLAGAGPLTSAELAQRAGCAERYVREWLGSQVAAAYIDYDPATETYELPAEHAAVLVDALRGWRLDATYSAKAFAVALDMAADKGTTTLFWMTFDSRWMKTLGEEEHRR